MGLIFRSKISHIAVALDIMLDTSAAYGQALQLMIGNNII